MWRTGHDSVCSEGIRQDSLAAQGIRTLEETSQLGPVCPHLGRKGEPVALGVQIGVIDHVVTCGTC